MNMNFNYPYRTREDFLEDVVKSLIDLRVKVNMTQDDINHKLGVADRLVSKWECGVRTPTSFHLYCWADALNGRLTIVSNDRNDKNITKQVANDNHQTIKK
jgi:transcriptional regulator with XRE-family HTH domain